MSQWIIDNVKGAGVWAVEIIQFSTVSFKITGQRTVHDSDKVCTRFQASTNHAASKRFHTNTYR